MGKLPRSFYERDTLTVARELLGQHLVHDTHEGRTVGRIVEVEAYIGPGDAAAHAYEGRNTERTRIVFGQGGHAYVFLIYGMYHCFNIVTNRQGFPEVVLVRALEPVEGIEIMERRRGTGKLKNLCSGPGKLCQAMGISLKHYGADLCSGPLYLAAGRKLDPNSVETTPRINIDYAGEAREYPWRFIMKNNAFLSVKSLRAKKENPS